MPPWLKILLIIFAAGMLVLGAGIFFAIRWFQSHEGELRGAVDQAEAEGKRFGEEKSADACVAETLTRGDRCGPMGMLCEVRARIFMKSCLEAATTPDDFCTNVPKTTNLVGSVRWKIAECARRGRANDQRCTRLIEGVQDHCK